MSRLLERALLLIEAAGAQVGPLREALQLAAALLDEREAGLVLRRGENIARLDFLQQALDLGEFFLELFDLGEHVALEAGSAIDVQQVFRALALQLGVLLVAGGEDALTQPAFLALLEVAGDE